jgi:hypothetical protein
VAGDATATAAAIVLLAALGFEVVPPAWAAGAGGDGDGSDELGGLMKQL